MPDHYKKIQNSPSPFSSIDKQAYITIFNLFYFFERKINSSAKKKAKFRTIIIMHGKPKIKKKYKPFKNINQVFRQIIYISAKQ